MTIHRVSALVAAALLATGTAALCVAPRAAMLPTRARAINHQRVLAPPNLMDVSWADAAPLVVALPVCGWLVVDGLPKLAEAASGMMAKSRDSKTADGLTFIPEERSEEAAAEAEDAARQAREDLAAAEHERAAIAEAAAEKAAEDRRAAKKAAEEKAATEKAAARAAAEAAAAASEAAAEARASELASSNARTKSTSKRVAKKKAKQRGMDEVRASAPPKPVPRPSLSHADIELPDGSLAEVVAPAADAAPPPPLAAARGAKKRPPKKKKKDGTSGGAASGLFVPSTVISELSYRSLQSACKAFGLPATGNAKKLQQRLGRVAPEQLERLRCEEDVCELM